MTTERDIARAARQAVADQISAYFGYDEVVEGDADLLGDLDEAYDDVLSFEIESEVQDLEEDELLSDLYLEEILGLDEEDEEDLLEVLSEEEPVRKPLSASSRLLQARSAREAFGARQRGGVLRSVASLAGAAAQGVARSGVLGQEFKDGFRLEDLAFRAGSSIGEVIPEAADGLLPPVFISDDVTPSASLVETDEVDLEVSPEFGATAAAGFVDRMKRPSARSAATRALHRDSKRLSSVPWDSPSAFVEDASAAPVLCRDGKILDEVHGSMALVPCPSCCRVKGAPAFGALARDCACCDGFGALLVPDSDLGSFMSSERFGFVQVLLPLVAAGTQLGMTTYKKRQSENDGDLEARKASVMQRLLSLRGRGPAVAEEAVSLGEEESFGFLLDEEEDEDYGSDGASGLSMARVLSPCSRR